MSTPTRTCPSCRTPLPGVAAFCYVCGTETPTGINLETGERVAYTPTQMTAVDLAKRLQRALGPGYELGKRIGAGGFAEVFRAQDLRLKRPVAVKVLRPDLGLGVGMLERFRREAEVIAALRHPNIVPIYDVGEAEGLAFIIMPFIAGESLRAKIEREGQIPVETVRRVLRESSAGLAAAHDAGVIHRDIKPENIMLDGADERVLLMDFGIAKAVGGEEETPATEEGVAPALTSTGIIVGTPQYMSPEQACGDKTIDARTDQYSLAVVGYRMLAGTLPFEGDSTRSLLYQQLVADPLPIDQKVPGLPAGLTDAIMRAMAKEPRDRFATMSEFAETLSNDAAPVAAARVTTGARTAARSAARQRRMEVARRLMKSSPSPARLAIAGVALVAVITTAVIALSGGAAVGEDFSPMSALDGSMLGPDSATVGATPPPANAASTPPANASRGSATRSNTASNRTSPPPAPAPAPPPVSQTAATPEVNPASNCFSSVAASRWSEASTECTTAAEAGNAMAMRHLAAMYDRGNGTPENPSLAVTWYRRAAANDPESKYQLSRLYDIGRGVPRDANMAIRLLRETAATPHLQAKLLLAQRLENGAGMKRDEQEAALWYRQAADQGSTLAMVKLADWSARGRGMSKDEAGAVGWYEKAAEGGVADAAWQAARAYLEGRGVAVNESAGKRWLQRAADMGHEEASKKLAELGG